MPCANTSVIARPELEYEPALSQLRAASADDLETLVVSWLANPFRRSTKIRECPAQSGSVTFHLLFDFLPVPFPLRVRIHQRRSSLQVHHVDAFAGHLLRAGVTTGVLVSTGGVTIEAIRAVGSLVQPRIRLYTGSQWASELVQKRIALRRTRLWRWVLAALDSASLPSRQQKGAR